MRWRADFMFINKSDDFSAEFEEMDELQEIAERGANWEGLIRIEIIYQSGEFAARSGFNLTRRQKP